MQTVNPDCVAGSCIMTFGHMNDCGPQNNYDRYDTNNSQKYDLMSMMVFRSAINLFIYLFVNKLSFTRTMMCLPIMNQPLCD